MHAYLEIAPPVHQSGEPIFRTARGRTQVLQDHGMTGDDILRMFNRRLEAAALPTTFSCHSCRKATATNLLERDVELADVAELPRTR